MTHEFNEFQLEDNSHLGMGFHVHNRNNFRYCSLSTRCNSILINTTGTNLTTIEQAIVFASELQICMETMNHFNQIINSK